MTIVRLPTGSALHRAMHCPASCALPSHGRTTEEATQGTANHSVMETAALACDSDPTWADKLTPSQKELFLVCTADSEGKILAVERTYALDVETGVSRHLGDRLERKYDEAGRKPTEIVATVDLVVRLPNGRVRVVDWKSRKRVTEAAENWQMRIAAMGAAAVEEGHHGDIEMVLGYLDDGEMDLAECDAFDISGWWHEVFKLRDTLRGAPATMIHEGPWCEYCPCMNVCPTKTSLALAMLGELNVAGQIVEMSTEQAGRVYMKAKQAADIVDRVLSAVKDRARQEAIPLPNGKSLVIQERQGNESLDREAVAAVFAELGKPLPMKRGKPFTTPVEVSLAPKKRTKKSKESGT